MGSNYYLSKLSVISICLLSNAFSDAKASLRVAKIFSDNMVLQQGALVPVWGVSDPEKKVTAEFAGQKVVVTSDERGKWKLNLKPMEVNADPEVFKVSTEKETVSFNNVVVGEVWEGSDFQGGCNQLFEGGGSLLRES